MELRGSGEPVRLSLRPAMLQAPGDHLPYGQVRRAQVEVLNRLRYSTELRTTRGVEETPTTAMLAQPATATSSVCDSHYHQQAYTININKQSMFNCSAEGVPSRCATGLGEQRVVAIIPHVFLHDTAIAHHINAVSSFTRGSAKT